LGNIKKLTHKTTGNAYNWTRNFVYATDTNSLLKHDTEQTINDYEYDAHGNITKMPHLPLMEWTFKDELKEVTLNTAGNKAYYVYDSSGERTRKVVEKGNIKEERYYFGDYEIYRKFVNQNLDTELISIHIKDDMQRIAVIDKGINKLTVRYQLSDHLGSSCVELNENTDIISYEEYHPFGTTSYQKSNTSISQKRYKYVGKERDEETGLYYYGARYYAAWLCRFVSTDPLKEKYLEWSPYVYCADNPVRFVDPDGMATMDPPWVYGQLYSNSIKEGHITSHDIKKNLIGALAIISAPLIIFGGELALPSIAKGVLTAAPYATTASLLAGRYGPEAIGFAAGALGYDGDIPGTEGDEFGKLINKGLKIGASKFYGKFSRYADEGVEFISSHLNGIDFRKDVFTKKLEKGSKLYQWTIDGVLGDYFSTNPDNLNLGLPTLDGIPAFVDNVTGKLRKRTLVEITLDESVEVLQSTASDADSWIPAIKGKFKGGDTQIFSPEIKNIIKKQ